jgi:Holliday junction DNA helicase RuvA
VILRVGGVSLQVYLPASTLSKLGTEGDRVRLYTHLYLRQDNVALYGFLSPEERELFKTVLSVDGVGPRLALTLLSALSPEQLAMAIASGNAELLSRLPGVGRKTASRLVLELKGKLEKSWSGVTPPYLSQDSADIVTALTSLGYSAAEAAQALTVLPDSPDLSLEDKIKLALQYFAAR